MRIALLEMSFSARAVLPFVAELQKHAEVDCLVTEPQLLEHFRYYGVPCRLLDVDAEARVVAAMSGGAELIIPPTDVCEHAAAQFASQTEEHVAFAWEAALRLIETDKPDYRS